jgi:hypothetical protein
MIAAMRHAADGQNKTRFSCRPKMTDGHAHGGRSAGHDQLLNRISDSNTPRQALAARGARVNVKPMPNRIMALRFNNRLYRKPNLVGRIFCKITRYHCRHPLRKRHRQHRTHFNPQPVLV